MLLTWHIRCLLSQAAGHHSHSHQCYCDVEGLGCKALAGVTVRRITAAVAHGVDGPFHSDLVHLAAVPLRHAAPGRQGAVVAVATVRLVAQLVWRALCHDEVKCLPLLQDGAVVAEQVLTEQRGQEEVEPQHSDLQELRHVRPASGREAFKGALCNILQGCKQRDNTLDTRNSSLEELT